MRVHLKHAPLYTSTHLAIKSAILCTIPRPTNEYKCGRETSLEACAEKPSSFLNIYVRVPFLHVF